MNTNHFRPAGLAFVCAGWSPWLSSQLPHRRPTRTGRTPRSTAACAFSKAVWTSTPPTARSGTGAGSSVNAGSTVVNGALAGLAEDTDDRVAYGSQAVLGALGTADLLFRPLKARLGADPIRDLPEDTRAQKLAKLGAAEDLLRSNAERVPSSGPRSGRTWPTPC